MAQLVVLLPARQRANGSAAASHAPESRQLSWVLSPDGQQVARQGRSALADLPPADTLVAVCPPTDIAWHRIDLPKAPAARLQAALAGVMEERLLEDTDQVQFAVQPGATGGQPAWVAVLHRPWLQGWLSALAAQQRTVDRLVPVLAPGGTSQAHAFVPDLDPAAPSGDAATARPWALTVGPDAALCLPLAGTATAALTESWRSAASVAWSASPAAATATERALGRPVSVRSDAEIALAAAGQRWQLLQFDLAPRRRGLRSLAQALQALRSPAWRPLRWGLVGLVAVNLIGLNAHAWQQRRSLEDRRAAMDQLLRETHPQVRAVLDAPVQMRTETDRLRSQAGVASGDDLEALLGAVATAWPAGVPAPPDWQFRAGRLSLPQGALPAAQADALRQRLAPAGFGLQLESGRWAVLRANGSAGASGQSRP